MIEGKNKSREKEPRQFGLAAGTALGIWGTVFYLRHKVSYPYFFIFSFVLIFLALLRPVVLGPVQRVWMTIGRYIGTAFTGIILVMLFYFVITPIAVLMRMLGGDFLDVRFNPQADSYWIVREPVPFDKKNYDN